MLTPISVANPRYSSVNGLVINCEVSWQDTLDGTILEPTEFSASSLDVEQHGIDLYNALVGGTYGPVAPMLSADVLDGYKFDLTSQRFSIENEGVVINGTINFQSDSSSRMLMSSLSSANAMSPMTSIYWTEPDGNVATYSAANFNAIFGAIGNFANDCMLREQQLIADLDAASDPSNVDLTVGWPSNQLTVTLT